MLVASALLFVGLGALCTHAYINERTVLDGSEWAIDSSPLSLSERMVVEIGLVQPSWSKLESTLYSTSDPSNPSYGKHLTRDQVVNLLRPSAECQSRVNAWLTSHKIKASKKSVAGDWYTLNITVADAQALLNTTFTAYVSQDFDRIIRAQNYTIPPSVLSSIETIQPSVVFPFKPSDTAPTVGSSTPKRRAVTHLRRFPSKAAARSIAARKVVPKVNKASNFVDSPSKHVNCSTTEYSVHPGWCLKIMYNAANYTPTVRDGNSVGVAGFLGQYPSRDDLPPYFKVYDPKGINYTFSVESASNTPVFTDQSHSGEEAMLDITTVAGLVWPIPLTFYSTEQLEPSYNPEIAEDVNTNEPYLDLIDYLLDGSRSKKVPSVLTTSYGDDEQTVPKGYAIRVCRGFAALGAIGTSVVFSSDDVGVGPVILDTDSVDYCHNNDGSEKTRFVKSFPASCPYVTSVGGVIGGDKGYFPPNQAPWFASGGGFSDYFATPPYQKSSVSSYLDFFGLQESKFFNRGGRGIPDLASISDGLPYYHQGQYSVGGQTSGAVPTVAGFVALLNDYRLKNGKPILGFLNPLFYSAKGRATFTDITAQGAITGCFNGYFNSTKGWDPTSGLGTLNFGELQKLL